MDFQIKSSTIRESWGFDLGGKMGCDIEATEGVYDWSSIDTQLAQAEAHERKVLLGITSGGLNVR